MGLEQIFGQCVCFKVRYWEKLAVIACSVPCPHPVGAPGASQHLRQVQTLETLPKCPFLPLLHLQQGTSWTLSPGSGVGPQETSQTWLREEALLPLSSTTFPAQILANPSHLLDWECNPLLLKTGTLFAARMPHFPCYPWVSWAQAAPGTRQDHLCVPCWG